MNQFIFLSFLLLSFSINSYGETAKVINKDFDGITNHQKLSSIERCLKAAIYKEQLKLSNTQITFLLFDEISRDPNHYQKTESQQFCKSIISRIKKPIKQETSRPEFEDLGSSGKQFAIKNVLLKLLYNNLYAHFVGHSDFTQRGFDRFFNTRCQKCINSTAKKLLISASQAPDLYHWKDEKYHAHTNGKTNNPKESQKGYLCEIQKLMMTTEKKINQGRVEDALVYFGEILHMLQDLVFHQGMTMTEHAVLSFLEDNDPDQPNNDHEREKRFSSAELVTVEALQAFEKRIRNKKTWDFIMSTNNPRLIVEKK